MINQILWSKETVFVVSSYTSFQELHLISNEEDIVVFPAYTVLNSDTFAIVSAAETHFRIETTIESNIL